MDGSKLESSFDSGWNWSGGSEAKQFGLELTYLLILEFLEESLVKGLLHLAPGTAVVKGPSTSMFLGYFRLDGYHAL